MADAKAAALERPESARKRHLEAFARDRAQGIDIHAFAHLDGGDRHGARSRDPAVQEQRAFARPALDCRLHRAREQRVAGEYRVEPFALEQRERRLDPVQQILRRGAAEFLIAVGRPAPLPVPVMARSRIPGSDRAGTLVHRDETEAGRRHQSLLRGTHRDVHAQRIHRERRGGERRHHVDDEQRRVPGRVDRRADRFQVVADSARGVRVHDEDCRDLALSIGAQPLLDLVRVDRIALAVRRADRAPADCFGLQRPLLGKVSGARNQKGLAGRKQVLRGRFPRAVTVRGIHEQVRLLGPQQPPQAGFADRDDLVQPRVGVIHRLAVHRIEHLGRDVRGTGRVKKALAGNADRRGNLRAIAVQSGRALNGTNGNLARRARETKRPYRQNGPKALTPSRPAPHRQSTSRQIQYAAIVSPPRQEHRGHC